MLRLCLYRLIFPNYRISRYFLLKNLALDALTSSITVREVNELDGNGNGKLSNTVRNLQLRLHSHCTALLVYIFALTNENAPYIVK